MQVGDFVGWADTWSDEEGCGSAGIIVDREDDYGKWIWFLILMHSTGKMSWERDKDLIMVFKRAKLLDEK